MGLFTDKQKIEDEANKALEDKDGNTEENQDGDLDGNPEENQAEDLDGNPEDNSDDQGKLPNSDGELECEVCGSSRVIKRESGFIQCQDCNHLNRNV